MEPARDLRLLLIFMGAVCGQPFPAPLPAGALSHTCVIGILIRGWLIGRPPATGPGGEA